MKMTKLTLTSGTVILLAGFVIARTTGYKFSQPVVQPKPQFTTPAGAAGRLAGALRIPTVSPEDPAVFNDAAFQRHDPFGGKLSEGFVWGRGALDSKSTVMGTLEAAEMLLGEGFRPARTVYLSYGHDEEVGGAQGSQEIAKLLHRRGIRLEMVLDEGGVISNGVLPGGAGPIALVGVAEKGFVSIKLSTRGAGGHSSLPPAHNAIGILSSVIQRLEKHPMAARMEDPARRLFEHIGPQLPFTQRVVFANLWLTRALVIRKLERSPATNAMVRTTTVPTIFQAGTKDNLLPSEARAVINARILPGDSIARVVEHVRSVIEDPRVEVRVSGRFSSEPSAVSSSDSDSFRSLASAIRSIVPNATVAPYLVVTVTDARYYSIVSDNIFRFQPVRLASRDLERMHGIDERIGVQDYLAAIHVYRQVIRDTATK